MSWTKEAEERMERVPSFVRNMARMAILRYAQDKGHTGISSSIIDEAMALFMPQGARQGMSGGRGEEAGCRSQKLEVRSKNSEEGSQKSEEGSKEDEEEMLWEVEALWELQKIEDPSVREQVRLRTEKRVKIMGRRYVTRDDIV